MSKLNENKPGYKMTKVGWIPEEWECVKLKEIAKINPESITEKTDKDYTFYYIDLSAVDEGKIEFSPNKIIFSKAPSRARRIVKRNDSLLATVRPNLKGFAYINFEANDVICSTGYAVLRGKKGVGSLYIYHNLFSHETERYFYNCVVGSNYPALNNSDVDNLKVPLPPLPEQKKIAEILSAWDRAIEQVRKLLTAKTKFKKALMQQLLTSKLRFKEFKQIKWQKMKLHDFLNPASRPVPRPDKEYLALGLRSHGKGTFLRTVDNPEDVMMDTLYEVKENDLIVNITFAWEGAIAIVKKSDEGALVSHRFPTYVFKREKAIPEYFRHVILIKWFVHQLGLISPGGAGRNRVLSKKDFSNLSVFVPQIVEQKKIGAILNGLDKEIALIENRLSTLKKQKKGLMQKLLTGQIRVKV